MFKQINFPKPFHHNHQQIQNVNQLFDEQRTFGQRTADHVAKIMGSWKFIIIQTMILSLWVILNIVAWTQHWDPYPFILMNLVLSLQAAYAAPIIMMSQNRQAQRDRLEAHNDYLVNQKAEEEIRIVLEHLDVQNTALNQIQQILLSQTADSNKI